jgi:hypothetical protein
MIRGGEVLLALAQIAVGLAGFSGVVAAFSRSRGFRVEDRVRFLMLVGSSFIVIVLSFVPFLLDLSGVREPAVWRLSSAAWLIVVMGSVPLILLGRSVILRSGRPAPGWSVVLILFLSLAATGAQVCNLVSWPYAPGPVPFILGLMAGLAGGGAVFVYLVLIPPSPSELDQ